MLDLFKSGKRKRAESAYKEKHDRRMEIIIEKNRELVREVRELKRQLGEKNDTFEN